MTAQAALPPSLNLFDAYVWHFPDGLATLIGALLVVFAAWLAWRGVQQQIQADIASLNTQLVAQRESEAIRLDHEVRSLKAALHAELVVYSGGVIRALSQLNQLSATNPSGAAEAPPLIPPVVYNALVAKIGLLGEGQTANSIITFYANLSSLMAEAENVSRFYLANATEASIQSSSTGLTMPPMNTNPFLTSNAALATRFGLMARNLAEAINGLSITKFPIPADIQLTQTFGRGGGVIGKDTSPPKHLDELLVRMAI